MLLYIKSIPEGDFRNLSFVMFAPDLVRILTGALQPKCCGKARAGQRLRTRLGHPQFLDPRSRVALGRLPLTYPQSGAHSVSLATSLSMSFFLYHLNEAP